MHLQVVLGEGWANDGRVGVRPEGAAAASNVAEAAQPVTAADTSVHGGDYGITQCGFDPVLETTEAPAAGTTSAGGLIGWQQFLTVGFHLHHILLGCKIQDLGVGRARKLFLRYRWQMEQATVCAQV